MVNRMNITHAFIKEIEEEILLISVEGNDMKVELTKEDALIILEAIEHGTYIIPFDLDRKKIVTEIEDAQLLKHFPETKSVELIDADIVPAEFM